MKKSLIAAVFTIGLIGNAFAGCEEPIYNAPEELQPSCVEATATAPDAQTLSTKELQRKAAEDAAKVPDTDSASVRVSDESSQSRKR